MIDGGVQVPRCLASFNQSQEANTPVFHTDYRCTHPLSSFSSIQAMGDTNHAELYGGDLEPWSTSQCGKEGMSRMNAVYTRSKVDGDLHPKSAHSASTRPLSRQNQKHSMFEGKSPIMKIYDPNLTHIIRIPGDLVETTLASQDYWEYERRPSWIRLLEPPSKAPPKRHTICSEYAEGRFCSRRAQCPHIHAMLRDRRVRMERVHSNLPRSNVMFPTLPQGMDVLIHDREMGTHRVYPSDTILVTRGSNDWIKCLPGDSRRLFHCYHFRYSGLCERGDQCTFMHVIDSPAPGGEVLATKHVASTPGNPDASRCVDAPCVQRDENSLNLVPTELKTGTRSEGAPAPLPVSQGSHPRSRIENAKQRLTPLHLPQLLCVSSSSSSSTFPSSDVTEKKDVNTTVSPLLSHLHFSESVVALPLSTQSMMQSPTLSRVSSPNSISGNPQLSCFQPVTESVPSYPGSPLSSPSSGLRPSTRRVHTDAPTTALARQTWLEPNPFPRCQGVSFGSHIRPLNRGNTPVLRVYQHDPYAVPLNQ